MNCCISSCVNNGTPAVDITYHEIPQEFELKQLWTEAIGTPEWELRPGSLVCCLHFARFDFIISETGKKELIYGAVPTLCLNTLEDLQTEAEFKTCRVCLAVGRKMFHIRDHNLHHLYKMIVGFMVQARDRLPQMMCWECKSKLMSLKKFKEQAQTSQILLTDKLARKNVLTVDDIKSIDRIDYNLKSNLTMKYNEPNQFDYDIEEFDMDQVQVLDVISELRPTLEIDGLSTSCKIPKCSKQDPTGLVLMVDSEQNMDLLNTSDSSTSSHIDGDMSPQHRDSNSPAKPRPAAKSRMRQKKLNVPKEKKSVQASRLNNFKVRSLTLGEQKAATSARAHTSAYLHAPYKCADCYRGFRSQDTFEMHALRHTNMFGKYRCLVCKLRHHKESQVREHIERTHSKEYTCKECGCVANNRTAAANHELKECNKVKCTRPNEFDFNVDVVDIDMDDDDVVLLDVQPDPGSVLEIDGLSTSCKIPKCSKQDPTGLVLMVDSEQNMDLLNTSDSSTSSHIDGDMSPQHRDSNSPAKPRPAAKSRMRQKKLNVPKEKKSVVSLKYFEVRHLTPEEQQTAVLARASSAAYLGAPFKCDVCYKGFLSRRTLALHSVRHTQMFGRFSCPLCKLRYHNEAIVRRHIRKIHAIEYACTKCSFVSKHRSAALSHQNMHDGCVSQCPHCPAKFIKKTSYLSHLRIKHASRFSCELCGFTFISEYGVRRHKVTSHLLDAQEELRGPYCEECKLRFANDEAYQRHLTQSSVHSSDTNPMRVYNEFMHGLKALKKTRLPQKITCEQCGSHHDGLKAYAKHFRAAHPGLTRTRNRKYQALMCERCGKKFQNRWFFREHMAWHAGRRYECDLCGKKLSSKFWLRRHLRRHETAEPVPAYPCTHCDRSFATYSSRARHVKTIHELWRYQCEICGKELTTMFAKREHIDHVHHKVPWPKRVRDRRRAPPATDVDGEV